MEIFELKHGEFLFFISRLWISPHIYVQPYSQILEILLSRNPSLHIPYITHRSQTTHLPSCPPCPAILTCHPSYPLFRWQNKPSSYSFTLRSDFNTCLNCVEGLHETTAKTDYDNISQEKMSKSKRKSIEEHLKIL